ncbi:MAG: signal peptide peptidase SppA [candidate division Zixibacteria bacterium]|nr:signal peptide peptidase SppA [candidate division Zixibacteria bacterium]
MAKKSDVVIAVIIVVSFLLISFLTLFAFIGLSGEGSLLWTGMGKRVAIVDVHGVIQNSSEVIRQLRKYAKDGSVPAVVVHIDSPGGGAAPSQEIYEEINKLRKKGKKVVASMGSIGASGGYYVACAADTIVANPATLTGSIGVIFQFPVAEELFKKIGIKFEVVKKGEIKDVGSIDRSMTKRERESLQSVVDDTYEQFVEVVVESRGVEKEDVLKIADGSVFTGRQARALGLVDELGNLQDAIKIAGEMVGIKEFPKTVKERMKKISWFDLLTQKVNDLLELDESEKLMPKLEYIFK